MTVEDLLQVVAGRPAGPALVSGDRVWSYADVATAVSARAARLRSEAGDSGPIVPVTLHADPSGVVELLALWAAGRVVAPLNPGLTPVESERARESLAGVTPPPGAAAVLWTSGTSGRPRGVALAMDNLAAVTDASAQRLSLSGDDVWLASLSLAHVGGLVLVVRALLLGGVVVLPQAQDMPTLSNLLDGKGLPAELNRAPTHTSLVPTQLLRLLDHRGAVPAPGHVRCVLVGGAHAPEGLVRRALASSWPVALTWGATEMTSQIATAEPALVAEKPGTVGAPLPGVECRVADDGELEVRGRSRALGYVGDEREGGGVVDEDGGLGGAGGWYRTGDLGSIDDDGHLWITGRRIDRIVSGGVTVGAREVEEVLRTHPTVIDACVVGVPDEEWGERVAAWIEPVEGEFDVVEIEEWIRSQLTPAKRPRLWHLGSALPRNANGKIDRGAVRAAFRLPE